MIDGNKCSIFEASRGKEEPKQDRGIRAGQEARRFIPSNTIPEKEENTEVGELFPTMSG